MYRIGDIEIKLLESTIASKQLFRVGNPASGHWQQVVNFEREFAQLLGMKHALLVSGGGTAALTCALIGLGIGPGDEVIVPAYTFMATASAVLMAGAIPVIADIDESLALSPEAFEKRISRHTKAVMPVHMIGRPADMDRIMEIAKRHGLKVIEDSCQAGGGSYKGRRLGSIGDAGAFSFNDFKILSCGEGGAMVTNDPDVYERASIFHDSGAAFRPYAKDFSIPVFLGQQLRASELMGAVLRGQLRRLEGILSDARRNAGRIRSELSSVSGLSISPMNDPLGDCGISVAFTFESEGKARKFAQSPGVGAYIPIDTGKHVFTNWEPMLKKNVYHHPRMNPFYFEENKGLRADYGDEVCAKTLDICKRTAIISVSPDWDAQTVTQRIDACRKAVL
ncbi:MAG: DegT/DnrJ/EryC1/StrS family aminotransferase [Victivallales bacterium]|jgi:dTDP-4-amino-4,6-dideoxygalactose transaminase